MNNDLNVDTSNPEPKSSQTVQKKFVAELASYLFRYIFLPNVLFIILRQFIFFDRPLINLDYIGLGLIAPLLTQRVNLLLFAIWLLLDFFVCATGTLNLPVADLIRSIPEIPQLSLLVFIPLILPFLLIVILMAKFASFCKVSRNHRMVMPSIVLLLFFLLANFAPGTGRLLNLLGLKAGELSGSTLWRFAYVVVQDFRAPDIDRKDFWTVSSATEETVSILNNSPSLLPDKVVLVLVESWGLLHDSQLRNRITEPFFSDSIRKRYKIKEGSVPFKGSTVAGEIRELCGIRGGFRESRMNSELLEECLPAKFVRAGYATTAIHGFKGMMFNRYNWYPNFRFQHQFFMENWPEDIPSNLCGSLFVGICDSDAGQLLRRELLSGPSKHFIYWLTLDSHMQFDGQSKFKCEEHIPDLLCDLATHLRIVTDIISSIASDPELPLTRFIVVGDHAPPILKPELRRMFSNSQVPFIELIPQ